jgi:Tol biopolymer transport system component
MLSGKRPFAGATDLEVLQRIIHGALLPLSENVPPPLRIVVQKALEKDPAERYQSMREMVVDLRRLTRATLETAAPGPSKRSWRWAAAIGIVLLAAGGLMLYRSQQPSAPARTQYTQLTNVDSAIDPALSPDGRMLTFVRGTSTGVQSTGDPTEIYIKLLPDGNPVQLMALETSGFNTYVVPVIGGQEPRRLLTNGEGMNWIDDKTILFSYMTGKGATMAVATSTESRSGERTVYVEDGIMNHHSFLSPDHKQLLMNAMGAAGAMGQCRLAPFDGRSKGKKVGPTGCLIAAWSPDGKFMYFSADTGNGSHIWRQRFPDGPLEQITSGTTEEEGVDVAPDGRSFVTSIGTFQDTIWVHDSRGDRQVTSESFSFQPTISAEEACG